MKRNLFTGRVLCLLCSIHKCLTNYLIDGQCITTCAHFSYKSDAQAMLFYERENVRPNVRIAHCLTWVKYLSLNLCEVSFMASSVKLSNVSTEVMHGDCNWRPGLRWRGSCVKTHLCLSKWTVSSLAELRVKRSWLCERHWICTVEF